MKTIDVLGVRIIKSPKHQILESIIRDLGFKKRIFIVTPNPEIVTAAVGDARLREILNSADYSVADGIGLKILGDTGLTTYKGRELVMDILRMSPSLKLKIFFYGASQQSNKRALEEVQKKFPKISIEGNSGGILDNKAEPVNEHENEKEKAAISKIRKFGPDIVFVALGAPKQEYWIAKHKGDIPASFMTVGGVVDQLSGAVPQVPRAFVRLGLEWLYRLISEPRRLGRILTATIRFPLLIVNAKLKFFFYRFIG